MERAREWRESTLTWEMIVAYGTDTEAHWHAVGAETKAKVEGAATGYNARRFTIGSEHMSGALWRW